MRLSQCMIVKNEEKNIRSALSWAKDIAYEQIVVDTGSTDRTVEIAKEMGAKVYHFEWIGDFSAAKNFAIDKAKGDWIAFLDADEYLVSEDVAKIPRLLDIIEKAKHAKMPEKGNVILCDLANLDANGNVKDVIKQIRFFRNKKYIRYRGKIHEQLRDTRGNDFVSIDLGNEITIYHTGYAWTEESIEYKRERNLSLLEKELEDNPTSAHLKMYMAQTYNFIGDAVQVLKYAKEAAKNEDNSLTPDEKLINWQYYMYAIYRARDDAKMTEEEVLEIYNQAAEFSPKFPDFDIAIGFWYHANKKWEQAREHFLLALQKGNDNGMLRYSSMPSYIQDIYNVLVEISLKLDNWQDVVKYGTLSLSANKKNEGILVLLLSRFLYIAKEPMNGIVGWLQRLYDFDDRRDFYWLLKAVKKAEFKDLEEELKNFLTLEELAQIYKNSDNDIMYDDLLQLINDENWSEAEKLLIDTLASGFNDTLAILAATIYEALGDTATEYDYIRKGLICNYANYELYLLLGNYYERTNINQAWLCYENAEFYCSDEADLEIIRAYKQNLEANPQWDVRKTSIVILSYNLKDIMKECIKSIRDNNPPSAYELVVVDNASTDGITTWLKEQSDIKPICNKKNVGFPKGCNQGIAAANPDNDIFLLNNDTIVPPNALFWLRMGLYESERVGATGSVSNYVSNYQRISQVFDTSAQYLEYAKINNIPSLNPYEKKVYLVGFALLLKREALNEIGLLDEQFTPGNFEDNDIGLRLQYAGWKVILCHNSFIYHYGSGNGKNIAKWTPAMTANEKKLKNKFGFNMKYYINIRSEIIDLIKKDATAPIKVLEIGCGMGMTLSRVKYMWPNAEVYGIELSEDIAKLGANQFDIIQGNAETMDMPYAHEYFDYIIFADVLEHLIEPEQLLKKMQPYLKHDGEFLCSIPNVMHWSVVLPLLQGHFDYQDAGILDRTHMRFFTINSIGSMVKNCHMSLGHIYGTRCNHNFSEDMLKLQKEIRQSSYTSNDDLFDTYQYIFSARKII